MKLLLEAWTANSLRDIQLALVIVLGVLLALSFARYVVSRAADMLAKRHASPLHRVVRDTTQATLLWLLLPVAAFVGASALRLPPKIEHIVDLAAAIALMLQAAVWGNRFIDR